MPSSEERVLSPPVGDGQAQNDDEMLMYELLEQFTVLGESQMPP